MKIDDKEIVDGFVSPVCSFCKHWHKFKRSCEAFDEIPEKIWEGKNSHKRPIRGDNGITFEKVED